MYPAGAVTNGYAPYHYPSTHEQQRWENFCYCGTNGTTYDNYGDYVVSIQRELLYWGYSSGTIDGYFDAAVAQAVYWFQYGTGLSTDSIVGYYTWMNLAAYCPYSYTASGYDYHHISGNSNNYWRHNISTDRWGIKDKTNSYWTSMTANGPT